MPNPTVPSNVPRPAQAQPNTTSSSSGTLPNNTGGPRIKTEPGLEPTIPNLPPNYGNNEARERAMANLQQTFGADASAQISQIQSQMLPSGQPRPQPMNSPRPPLSPEQQREQQAEYQRRQHAAAYHQMQQARQYPAAPNSQSDGANDWDGYVAERRLQASDTAREADLTIRQQVEQMNRKMEGGGLMMPLADQPDLPQQKRRKIDSDNSNNSHAALVAAQSSNPKHLPKIPQMDGGADEEEESKANIKDELFDDDDEDAINSDLDDPDENEIEEEQEDGKPTQVMLCTYDKVQRVKNKWKCTLRDGVLNSGGKE